MKLDTPTLLLLSTVLSILPGLMLLLVYQKLSLSISEVKAQLVQNSSNVFAQVEALLALQADLKLSHSLPPTRGWAASPDFLRNLVSHAMREKPNCILECSSGTSTIILARCMQILGKGHVYSLENSKEFAEKTRIQLRDHGLESFATVLDAPLEPATLGSWSGQWYAIKYLPPGLRCNLLVIDGPPWFVSPMARYPAVPMLHKLLEDDATIFLDDAARDDEVSIVKRWLMEFEDLKQIDVPACEKGCVALRKLPI